MTEVTIEHRLSSGAGHATLDVPGLTFGQNLQPDELTRLTQGVIALVNGTISGHGRIDWVGEKVTSSGDFTTAHIDLAAPFGPVTGMSGTIHFNDLLGLTTPPGQVMTVKSINPGILVENGVIHYQLLPGQLVKIERGEWPFMGGRLILEETVLNFGRPTAKRLTFEVVGLDAKTFVDSLGFKEIAATGTFDGVLPMIFDEEGGRIVGGRLDARPGGGTFVLRRRDQPREHGDDGQGRFRRAQGPALSLDDRPARRRPCRRVHEAPHHRAARPRRRQRPSENPPQRVQQGAVPVQHHDHAGRSAR